MAKSSSALNIVLWVVCGIILLGIMINLIFTSCKAGCGSACSKDKEGFQILVDNKTGERYRGYRPYIEGEEYWKSAILYDPNRPIHYGLYDGARPLCRSWHCGYKSTSNRPVSGIINRCGKYEWGRDPFPNTVQAAEEIENRRRHAYGKQYL